jgi:(p)ppGpp synthase/HD superfamily hydrolase
MKLIDKAMLFAMTAHMGQYRKHIEIPYFTHCMEVMKRVSMYTNDVEIWCIALLHDVLEDTVAPEQLETTYKEIEERFGERIAKGVLECSREGGDHVSKKIKYDFLCSFHDKSMDSILVKIADRYCNVRDYTKQKGTYYAKYAVQAYPLFKAYLLRDKAILEHNESQVINDLIELEGLMNDKYSINIFDMDISIEDKVKKIVL